MTHWYALDGAAADIFSATGPALHHYRYRLHYDAPPATVWASLASEKSLAAWGAAVQAVHWRTPRPFGVGTEREVVLAGGLARVRERFFRWDEGQGYSFAGFEASFPLFRRFAEDYVLEPDGTGTLFTWTVAVEAKPKFALPIRALSPVNRFAFGRLAADGRRYFAPTS